MTRVALVGAGVVGSSWSLVFARAGFDVAVYDADPARPAGRRTSFARRSPILKRWVSLQPKIAETILRA